MKDYVSVVKLEFGGNNFEAESIEEYRQKVKEYYYEAHNIELDDSEIQEIGEMK